VEVIAELSEGNGNRPFAVMDDGWQWKGESGDSPGLWNRVNPSFSRTMTMPELARAVRRLGARPGLWFRPLLANADQPQSWRLQRNPVILDPTVPQARAFIRQTVKRFRGWGYELIKHDFTTYDLCGRWGMDMHGSVTADGWAFADRSKTTAEVIRGLYDNIRSAAGNDTIILGCNTIGQISAGIFEMQRVGDDTSGNNWARTRKMGVNGLAFRAAQQGTFFAIDPDCVGQTSSDSIPWEKNSQWLYLVAHSGTPLFISIPREIVNPAQKRELREALSAASRAQPLAEPLDWMERRTPEQWLLDGQKKTFLW
jgi:alpha-galactosidase